VCVTAVSGVAGWLSIGIPEPGLISQRRNFFGVTRVVVLEHGGDHRHLVLYHGSTIHGMQYLSDTSRTHPTSYYGPESGAGLVLSEPGEGRRIGVIGLGAGVLASYGRAGDLLRFYEIDPNMIEVAGRYFDFMRRSAAVIETVPGDARISLSGEGSQHFDVLVVDAFSGDAIPMHLLTLEAFQLYLRHLRHDGVLIVHISNRYLDLAPAVWKIADELHLERALIRAPSNHNMLASASVYALLARSAERLDSAAIRSRDEGASLDGRRVGLWTDDYSNLLAALD
jgi:spermidine synthase